MKMVPRAGVEPATYRLGGESLSTPQSIDFSSNSEQPRPILAALHHDHKPLISKGVESGFGRHSSVLTERPSVSWDNLSRDAYLLWFWVGVALAVALVSWLVWDRRVTPKPSSPAPDPVRDQEWCHYPQPGDARSDKAS